MPNPPLPAEILDNIIDYLHDNPETLKRCCLVSKSWIPRTRKHLFADVKFHTVTNLQSWKEMFPDPSTSPARYAKSLIVHCPEVVVAADAETGGWITAFSRVVHLWVGVNTDLASFVPFHGFSPVVKSLTLTLSVPPSPYIPNLILSFPLLEDLAVTIRYKALTDGFDGSDWPLTVAQSSSPSTFTGSLKLLLCRGVKPITRWLLSLPGGIHFRKFIWRWSCEEDVVQMMELLEMCSDTIESLDIICGVIGKSIRHLRPYKITQYCL